MKLNNYIKNYSEIILFSILKLILPKSNNEVDKLLLINTGEIGDLVVSSIILENEKLLERYSDITFLIKDEYLELFERYKGKIKFVGYNYKKYKYSIVYKYQFLSLLRKKDFGTIIHLTAARGILNEEIVHLSGASKKIVLNSFWEYLGNYLGKYFDNKYQRILAQDILNEYDKHFALLDFFNKQNSTDEKIIFNKGITFNEEYAKREDYIVIAPYTSLMGRDWKKEYFIELIGILSKTNSIMLLGSKEQKDSLDEIKDNSKNIHVFAGVLKLNEIPSVIKKAKLFIGLDSGLTHIALKVGTPLIAIIGGGEFGRFFPHRKSQKVRFLYHQMDCFLCHWECTKKEMFCLTEIKPNDVLEEVEKIL